MFKSYLMIILLFFGISNVVAAEKLDRIVAIVGDEVITNSELQLAVTTTIKNLESNQIDVPPVKTLANKVLEQMILESLQLQMAKKFELLADETSTDQSIANIAKNNQLTINQLKEQLSAEGISWVEFRKKIRKDLSLSRLQHRALGNTITVSPAEIEGYINSPSGQDHSGVKYNLGHILIANTDGVNSTNFQSLEQKAKQVLTLLKQGKAFKELAVSYSSGSQAFDGGDLGWRSLNEIPSLLVKHVPGMKINQVIGPINSSSGLHIIKLQGKKDPNKEQILELKVRQILILPKEDRHNQQQIIAYLNGIREKIIDHKQSFMQAVSNYSEDRDTVAKGGDLGWLNFNTAAKDFWVNIRKLKKGEISQPFQTKLGWHIVLLEDLKEKTIINQTTKERAMEVLREQKFQDALQLWLKKLRKEANVKIYL